MQLHEPFEQHNRLKKKKPDTWWRLGHSSSHLRLCSKDCRSQRSKDEDDPEEGPGALKVVTLLLLPQYSEGMIFREFK